MSIVTVTWRPTPASVAKKNTKAVLANTLIRIYDRIQDCKDEETKDAIIRELLYRL